MKTKLLYGISFAIFLLGILLFQTCFLIGYVPTDSMAPTLKAGDIFIANRLDRNIEVGDIIVFKRSGNLLVKRVYAIGGTVFTLDGTDYTVPEGSFFVLGDHREASYDSRHWGCPFVDEADILAKYSIE